MTFELVFALFVNIITFLFIFILWILSISNITKSSSWRRYVCCFQFVSVIPVILQVVYILNIIALLCLVELRLKKSQNISSLVFNMSVLTCIIFGVAFIYICMRNKYNLFLILCFTSLLVSFLFVSFILLKKDNLGYRLNNVVYVCTFLTVIFILYFLVKYYPWRDWIGSLLFYLSLTVALIIATLNQSKKTPVNIQLIENTNAKIYFNPYNSDDKSTNMSQVEFYNKLTKVYGNAESHVDVYLTNGANENGESERGGTNAAITHLGNNYGKNKEKYFIYQYEKNIPPLFHPFPNASRYSHISHIINDDNQKINIKVTSEDGKQVRKQKFPAGTVIYVDSGNPVQIVPNVRLRGVYHIKGVNYNKITGGTQSENEVQDMQNLVNDYYIAVIQDFLIKIEKDSEEETENKTYVLHLATITGVNFKGPPWVKDMMKDCVQNAIQQLYKLKNKYIIFSLDANP